MNPQTKISDSLHGHGQLGRAYHNFLQSMQPVKKWGDLGTLAEPIPPKAEYPVDWELIRRWAASCPSLAGPMESVQDFDLIAPRLGWNYAWTRFPQHLYLLNAIEEMVVMEAFKPTIIIEPGCFTGGLLHYLANYWGIVPCVGFDISPVALDVCSYYSDRLEGSNSPLWLEADFSQVRPEDLPSQLGEHIDGGLVILSNVFESLGKSFTRYPYLDQWAAKSRLISYWVNNGANVLLCERHADPDHLMDTIVRRAEWLQPNCKASVRCRFTVPTTVNMIPENPLGDWEAVEGCVIRFSPPDKLKPKNKKF